MRLSIIIPSYNEEKTIEEVIKRVDEIELDGVEKEIILVDDGSIDTTEGKVRRVAQLFSRKLENKKSEVRNLIFLRHKKNKGKGAAIQTGIKNSSGEIIVIQDADLEYHPRDIPRLVKPIVKKESLVVYGTRLRIKPTFFGKNKTPFLLHFFGNKFLSLITSLMYGQKITDMETGHKAFSRAALNGIKLRAKSFDFEPEITARILKKGIKIREVDIKTNPRSYKEGKKINTIRDGFHALWTLVKYRFRN